MPPRQPSHLSSLDDVTLEQLAEVIAARRKPESALGRWTERLIGLLVAIAVAWMAMSENVATLKSRIDSHDQRLNAADDMLKEIRGDIKTLLQRDGPPR